MNKSETIINTYRNSIDNVQGDIKNLSKDDLAAIINLLSNEIDENLLNTSQLTTDSTSDHSINNNNNNYNEIMMRLIDQNSMLIKILCASHSYASHHQSNNVIYPVSSSNSLVVDNNLRINCTKQTTPSFPSLTTAINGAHSEVNNNNFASSVQQQQFTQSKSPLLSSTPQRQITTTSNIKTTTSSSTRNVLITGSSITRDLQQGNTILNNKHFNTTVRTKPNCTIKQMNESIKNKEFNETNAMIMCIGTINMKYDKPQDAFAKIIALIDSVKASYPKTKLIFTTIPKLNVKGIKSSVEQVNADVDEFNALLESLQTTDINIIKFGFQDSMLNKDGIHLKYNGSVTLSNDIDNYLKNFQ